LVGVGRFGSCFEDGNAVSFCYSQVYLDANPKSADHGCGLYDGVLQRSVKAHKAGSDFFEENRCIGYATFLPGKAHV
jgi:hypothetical protein